MWKTFKTFLVVAVILLGVFFLAINYLFRDQVENLRSISSLSKNVQSISSQLEENPAQNNEGRVSDAEENLHHKNFTSPDKKLQIEYLSNWEEVTDQKLLDEFSSENTDEYSLKTIFWAWKSESLNLPEELGVIEGYFEDQTSLEDIINTIKDFRQKEGLEVEITNSKIENNEAVFEANYIKLGQTEICSKEKIILIEENEEKEKVYIVSFFARKENWNQVREEAEKIIDSIQLNN